MKRGLIASFLTVGISALAITQAAAASMETLFGALAAAYANNPTLNASRAGLRATDENVPQALAGFRPTVAAALSGSVTAGTTNLGSGINRNGSIQITVDQPVFRGNRTRNSVRIAETAVLAGRESLRNDEQNVLLDAATAYMDVMRDRSILGLNAQNLEFLRAEVNAAQSRLDVGEGTRTDVAQANASLEAAQSQYAAAVAQLASSTAVYIQVIGHKPGNLAAASPIDRLLPRSVDAAIALALDHHPAIRATMLNADVAAFNVKVAEGALLPTVSVNATIGRNVTPDSPTTTFTNSASIGGRISIPLYSGGAVSSQVREAKETYSQRQIQVDVTRAQVRAAVASGAARLEAARSQLSAAQAQISAAQLVLQGVQEERKVGQRTTLDVLNAQSQVLSGRIALVRAQHDRVVATYSLLAAVGKLSAEQLGLAVDHYDPTEHYGAVRDLWFGLRTPDGR